MESKYNYLLKDTSVRRWHQNLSRGSQVTAGVYLRRLGNFCQAKGLAPKDLVRMRENKVYGLLLDTVTEMEEQKLTGSYIASVLKAVKSWLSFNGQELKRKIRIKGAQDTPSLRDERVPTQEELKRVFLAGDEKTRAACALVAHCGLRLEVLGNYEGIEGLRVNDLPELQIANGRIEFSKIPTLVSVRSSLSKKGHEYFTFLSSEGCEYLKEYLEMRIRAGERLSQESAIITPKIANKEFITTINISDIIRKAIRKAGFQWRPYVLRSYFDTQLMVAESKRLIIRDYRTFFMGHKGDIEHTYTLNKRRLAPDIVEDMRESYAKAEKYLQTIETAKEEDIKRMFKRQLLLVAGFKAEEITNQQLELNEEEFQKIVRGKLVTEMKNNGAKQRVVQTNEVESYLQEGWEFVGSLPRNKAILKLPELS
jgi:hypothetical protein